MTDQKIINQVLQNLKQIGVETGKEAVKHVGEITESVITGKEWLGNINTMSDQDLARKKAEDERKSQEEIARLTGGAKEPGRNVEAEIKEVQQEEKREEEQEKQAEANAVNQQNAIEAENQRAAVGLRGESPNPGKRKKKMGSALAQGRKKTQAPDPSQMSATAEFSGKME